MAENRRLTRLLVDHIEARNGAPLSVNAQNALSRAVPVLKTRAKTLPDLADQARFVLASRPLALDEKAKSLMKAASEERLRRLHTKLAAEPDKDQAALGSALKAFATDEGVGLGQIGPGLRAALTGGSPAPDLGQALELLGREEALARIADQVERKTAHG